MNQAALDLLAKDNIGVLSVTLPSGEIHSASVHISHAENPVRIFIQTSNSSLKAQSLLEGEAKNAAMVVGFSEEEWLTLQMHGTVRAVTGEKELEEVYKIHYKKHPDAEQYKGPKTIFLEFTPTWWRYTDFNTEPPTIIQD